MGKVFSLIIVACLLVSCGGREISTPKPRGYFRIDLPKKEYVTFDTLCPFSFQYPLYAKVDRDTDRNTEEYWYNIQFPAMKATLHLSYKPIAGNIKQFLEDSRTLVYKHTVKADAIDEKLIIDDMNRKFGIYYDIKGDAASSFQFILTDSTKHFLRGALYFNVRPNKDSLAPVLAFIKKDIEKLVESLRWKK